MLARRPMLCFAIAVMAGAIAARIHPATHGRIAWGWPPVALLWVWFLFSRRRAVLPDAPALPDGYADHILPRPGFLALRGVNRFILVLSLSLFLVGAHRQTAWSRRLSGAAFPAAYSFDAHFLALAPSREHIGENGRWRVPALLLTADGGAAGTVPVSLSGPEGSEFRRGDILRARARLGRDRPKPFPGAFDFAFWLEREGLAASLFVSPPGEKAGARQPYMVVAAADPSLATRLLRCIDAVRSRAIARTVELGGDQGAMLAAMLYGQRKNLDDDLRDVFRRVGIGHVLAISGLHVGLIVGLIWWASGWLGWSLRPRALGCIGLAFLYLGLAGGQVAASRATLMAVIHFGGLAWGRKSDMLNSLGAAAFFLALLNPSSPMDVSFQLSFTAVVFIYMALRRGPDREREPARRQSGPGLRRRVLAETISLVRLSIFTWVGLCPIIAAVFHQVNLVGLPINVVVIPLMSLVLAGGLLLPWIGWLPGMAWLLCLPARVLSALAVWADGLPLSSFPVHAPDPFAMFLFYLFVAVAALVLNIRPIPLRRRLFAGSLAAMGLAAVGMAMGARSLPPPEGGRLAVLPGRGFGVVVAESEDGAIALLGNIERGGLTEAEWLHRLRRGGDVAVVALAGEEPTDLRALSFHNTIVSATTLPATDASPEGMASSWRPVPDAEGVEYATSRDARGKLLWLAVRTGKRSVCVAPGLAERQLTWRLERRTPGFDAQLLCIGLRGGGGGEIQTGGLVALMRTTRRPLPAGWFMRDAYGVLLLRDDIAGFDGKAWRVIFPGT